MNRRRDPSKPYPTSSEVWQLYHVERQPLNVLQERWGMTKGYIIKLARRMGCPPRDCKGLPVYQEINRSKKAHLEVTPDQHQIILGTLLGDAHLMDPNRKGPGHSLNSYLRTTHSDVQLAYVEWLNQSLAPISNPIHFYQQSDGRRVYFTSCANRYFTELRHAFYPTGAGWKIFPEHLYQNPSPLLLAVWYMDDGTHARSGKNTFFAYFCTDGFKREDQERMQAWLYTNYNLRTTLNISNGKLYRIRIGTKEFPNFRDIISPFIIPEMHYKLD